MKRCPTCKRTFDDEAPTACPDDGSALTSVRETQTTQGYGALGGKATWNPSQDQIAEIQQHVLATQKPKRKVWPWIVVALVFLLVLIGLVAIVFSRL